MEFLMISVAGEGAGILKQLQDEGNDVELYIEEEDYKTVYDGILPKCEEINPSEDAIILFDMTGNGDIAEDLQKEGYKTFDGSLLADDLEHDRAFGLDMMRECGIKVPITQEFNDFEDVSNFLEQYPNKRFVFKPSGTMPCKLTYCSEDNNELVNYLHFVEDRFGDEIDSFVLQEFIEGEVISSEIWCDGTKIVGTPNHTIETKKFLNDNLGPSTGCSGNIICLAEGSKIVRDGVMKIADKLIEEGYVGQMDLNAVVNDEGIWGLEWTPRFGYDSMCTFMSMLDMEYGKFFADIVNRQTGEWKFKYESNAGIRLSIPPYPVEPEEGEDPEKFSPNMGVPIQGWETFVKNIYFYEVMMKDGQLCHSNGTGLIACVLHKNPDRVYEILDKLKVPDKQYRTDLVEVLTKMKGKALQYA